MARQLVRFPRRGNIFPAVVRSLGPPAPEAALRKIVREIQRRTVWQCLGIYVVGSWIALQVVDVLKDNMGLPDWVFPFAVVLLILGLPVVLATTIIQERLPGQGGDGVRRTPARPARSARVPEPGEYASSGSVYVASEPAAAVATPAEAASGETPHRRLFTWRNALGGGALAFLFLIVVTSGFMFMRANGIGPAGTLVARGLIDERSPASARRHSGRRSSASRRSTTSWVGSMRRHPTTRASPTCGPTPIPSSSPGSRRRGRGPRKSSGPAAEPICP